MVRVPLSHDGVAISADGERFLAPRTRALGVALFGLVGIHNRVEALSFPADATFEAGQSLGNLLEEKTRCHIAGFPAIRLEAHPANGVDATLDRNLVGKFPDERIELPINANDTCADSEDFGHREPGGRVVDSLQCSALSRKHFVRHKAKTCLARGADGAAIVGYAHVHTAELQPHSRFLKPNDTRDRSNAGGVIPA